jgi:creatinine amidohydrolase
MRPWRLDELSYGEVRSADFEVAVLPCGCTEPHNLHLPYGMDTIEADLIASRVCEQAHRRGAKVVMLPAIPYGTTTNMRELPLAMNLNPSTLLRVIEDLVQSLVGSGIRKILILNSHGGNDFKPVLRELQGRGQAWLFLADWFRLVSDVYASVFEHPEDHAGEMETSIALAYAPDLVRRDADGRLLADDGRTKSTRFEAINEGWVSISRPWHLLTTNTGSGNPHKAAAEKGERIVQIIVDRLAPFLVELSAADIDASFPFEDGVGG